MSSEEFSQAGDKGEAFNERASMESPVFRKASACSTAACVEVSSHRGWVLMRDSKNPQGPVHRFERSQWASFLARAKRGECDAPAAVEAF